MVNHKWAGVNMKILLVLMIIMLVNGARLRRSRTQRVLQRLNDLETDIKHIGERLTKETRYRREDLMYLQEQLDKITASNSTDQVIRTDKYNQPDNVHDNEHSIDKGVCARVAYAFPALKRDLYNKLEDTVKRVALKEEDMIAIQKQLIGFDKKINDVSQLLSTTSEQMQSEVKLMSERFDNLSRGTAEKFEKYEKEILLPTQCQDKTVHGAVTIYPNFQPSGLRVFCDQHTDGGGWIVFQRRQDGSVDFYRGWKDYEDGFGIVDEEFWLGNKYLHLFTKNQRVELRIDMKDFEGNLAFAHYTDFKIESPSDKYRLSVGEYSGTAGDGFRSERWSGAIQDGKQFSTFDSDNDNDDELSCAEDYKGGFWYNRCFDANLNGEYIKGPTTTYWQGTIWYPWKGYIESLKFVEMKFRTTT